MRIGEYFHGTWEGNGYSIMTRGFELDHDWGHGSNRGRGVYVAQKLESAANWTWGSGVIIRCHLQPGTRILWMDGHYDQRVISTLRREFGNELLEFGPQFHKAIPHNKQLTRQELIHLTNYILMHPRRMGGWGAFKGKKARYFGAWLDLSRLHEQIKRHDYDALGDRSFEYWDSDEVVVFNPARVIPVSAHRLFRSGSYPDERFSLSDPLDLETLQIISEEAQEEFRKWEEEE
ncbi:MAG: hypothetical protein ACK2U5_16505 [Candidatus Promineifilaceae bacterium]